MQKLARILLPAVFAFLIVGSAVPVNAATAQFSLTAVTDKGAYYIGEPVNLRVDFSWENLASNHTVVISLYALNGTKLQGLHTLVDISGNGTYTNVFSISGLTEEKGSTQYIVKAVENDIVLAEDQFTVNVETPSYRLTVAWSDETNDRKIDVNELITFNIFIDWAFLNASQNATLYVSIDGNEQIIQTVNLAHPSGSAQITYQITFDKEGVHTVVFSLRDSKSNTLASKAITFKVGEVEEQASIFGNMFGEYTDYVVGTIILVGIIAIVVFLVKK
ncbi:MAG: hypothetical protein ACP6IS_11225 [Candidatus Asgardarchaeia archaeon]